MRKNNKLHTINFENSIKKSNQLSMAKLSQGLSLNQLQLFSFAIFSTQRNGQTKFHKSDFEQKFGLHRYKTEDAKQDTKAILNLKFSIESLQNDVFEYYNVFQFIKYDSGLFQFEWTTFILPHILELKEKYITTDLSITAQFKSAFSWLLYEYLKAHYGYWHKQMTKQEMMKLFGVESKKSYATNTADFKKKVLDVAIDELNKYTELEVWYKEKKNGRAIAAFDLHWSVPSQSTILASKSQVDELYSIIDTIENDMFNYLDVVEGLEKEELSMIKNIKRILDYRKKITDTLTATEAKNARKDLILYVRILENQLESARKLKKVLDDPNYVPFYNWLEERD
ncbi:replication initiation protein [Caryophanon latum]|uniref:Initiator Rep protein WH1 domain-containing protein n=1 Tax=Caryophanon latum TaxID=33977 RepID=A0A1C0YZM3_9BACL|nr:replication initiation protein [Caryophanon latum]OCS92637.1 hypothetical protein A6K76_06040 [Caryophanon latum]